MMHQYATQNYSGSRSRREPAILLANGGFHKTSKHQLAKKHD